MRKLVFIILAGLALSAMPAAAQFTIVTGTVSDTNGLAWDCGTISAQLVTPGGTAPTLNGVGFTTVTSPVGLGCSQQPSTGASGSFTMRLADNNVVLPSGTKWKFTANIAPGILPPGGTGPQTCTATLTITGASQSITSSFSACPALSKLVGSGAPAAPSGSVQYNNGGVFGGTVLNYNPAAGVICTGTCALFTSNASSGFLLNSTDALSSVSFKSENDTVSGNPANESISTVTVNSSQNFNYVAQSRAGGANTGGGCYTFSLGGTPTCVIGFYAEVGDNGSDIANGQDAVGFGSALIMAKSGGHTVHNFSGFAMYTPSNAGAVTAETATNVWGLEVQDLQGLGTTQTAGIHIEAQTNPSAAHYAIKLETGAGPSAFQAVNSTVYQTNTNCLAAGSSVAASAVACGSAAAGMFSIPITTPTSAVVTTTALTANSEISVTQRLDTANGAGAALGVTCNVALNATAPNITARTATTFTITFAAFAGNPGCYQYTIAN